MSNSLRILMVGLLVGVCASLTFLSFDFNSHRELVYRADLGVKPDTGPIRVAFYGGRWETYRADGSVTGDLSNWAVTEQSDSTVITSRNDRASLRLRTYGTPLLVSLVRLPGAGTAVLTDAANTHRYFSLSSDAEAIESLTIGGEDSAVPATPGTPLPPRVHYGLFVGLLAGFSLLALYQLYFARRQRRTPPPIGAGELFGFGAPLLASALLVQLAYWPAGAAYDGGLQWLEAFGHGRITDIGIPATLLFRHFAERSPNPAWLVFTQVLLGGVATALVLRELRHLGVPRWAAQSGALLIALTPQYPTFITVISKDAWNAVGLLFTVFFALKFLRLRSAGASGMASLALMGGAAVFAGLMRANTIPAITMTMLAMVFWLRPRLGLAATASLFAVYLTAMSVMPGILVRDADGTPPAHAVSPTLPQSRGMPFSAYANIYIYHLFAALQHRGIQIAPADAGLFFAIAPAAAWSHYDCAVQDRTQIAVSQAILLSPEALNTYLADHQQEMAWVVVKSVLRHPEVLLERQLCVSALVWYIGYGINSYQANATLGYDAPPPEFVALAGDNRSLVGSAVRKWVSEYVHWTESWNNRWLFWRPFLYCILGLYAILLFALTHRRSDVLVVGTLPLMLSLSLALLIPFPAFRYQYPATLIFTLLALLAVARPKPAAAPTCANALQGTGAEHER